MKSNLILFATLTLAHAVISTVLYHAFSQTTLDASSDSPIVETTTLEERAHGGASFTSTHTELISVTVPGWVIRYTRWGYVFIAATASITIWRTSSVRGSHNKPT